MTEIAIYVEGGGDTAQQRAELRMGFDELLAPQKTASRNKRLRWKLVPSGGRNSAYLAFINAARQANKDSVCVLLVDSEEAVPAETVGDEHANAEVRKQHLTGRDGWDFSGIPAERIHLMVQCMEAWIVADPAALAEYYGKKFHPKSLPGRINLEEEPKLDLYAKLAKATKDTVKGAYSEANNAKIKHASKLLALLDPKKVAQRCPRFATLTGWLDDEISDA